MLTLLPLAGAVTPSGTFLAGSYDGRLVRFEADGKADVVPGPGHTGQVVGIAGAGEKTVSVGFDDCAREVVGGKFGCVLFFT